MPKSQNETAGRPCLSWRQPGGFWSLHEDGAGERLRIQNSMTGQTLDELDDQALLVIHALITEALRTRHPHDQ